MLADAFQQIKAAAPRLEPQAHFPVQTAGRKVACAGLANAGVSCQFVPNLSR